MATETTPRRSRSGPLRSRDTPWPRRSRDPSGGCAISGFTDGDRAVFLADHFGAARIRLVGFDFETPNAKDRDLRLKQRKLDWAYILLGSLERDDLEL